MTPSCRRLNCTRWRAGTRFISWAAFHDAFCLRLRQTTCIPRMSSCLHCVGMATITNFTSTSHRSHFHRPYSFHREVGANLARPHPRDVFRAANSVVESGTSATEAVIQANSAWEKKHIRTMVPPTCAVDLESFEKHTKNEATTSEPRGTCHCSVACTARTFVFGACYITSVFYHTIDQYGILHRKRWKGARSVFGNVLKAVLNGDPLTD